MDNPIFKGIAQATELTRAGQLKEATALIGRTLQGLKKPPTNDVEPSYETIDVTAEDLDEPLIPSTLYPGATNEQTNSSGKAQKIWEQQERQPPQSDQPHKKDLTPLWENLRKNLTQFTPLETIKPRGKGDSVDAKGQFIEGSYRKGTLSRNYKLYIPSGYKGQALPLVVMLHGCTQSVDDFALGTGMNLLAEKELFFVLYPAQEKEANSSKCWNWFKTSEQQRDRGEPSIIAGITAQVINTYNLERSQVYVSGMSAGGAMAAIMGICYPDVYAAVGIHSGLPYGAASDLGGAFAAMHNGGNDLQQQKDKKFPSIKTSTQFIPLIVFHGDRDTTVHPNNSLQVISQWAFIHAEWDSRRSEETLVRVRVIQEKVKNGHAYTRSIYHDLEGSPIMERWLVHGAGHGWSGGNASGSFTDFRGPDASQEMLRFFKEHPKIN